MSACSPRARGSCPDRRAAAGFDARDPRPGRGAAAAARGRARGRPLAPDLAFVRSPVWDQAEADLEAGFAELAEELGRGSPRSTLPEAFAAAHGLHGLIMGVDLARSFAAEYERGRDQLSERLREIIEDGRQALAIDYARALDLVPALRAALDPLFARYDVILTPATSGQAPRGLDATGSPAFCTIWTLLGLPAVTVPLLTGADGLPIGVQLVGRFGDDARLLRAARWLVTTIAVPDARTRRPQEVLGMDDQDRRRDRDRGHARLCRRASAWQVRRYDAAAP